MALSFSQLVKILVLGPDSDPLRNRVPEAWTILLVKTFP
jgi:hypothetical protein